MATPHSCLSCSICVGWGEWFCAAKIVLFFRYLRTFAPQISPTRSILTTYSSFFALHLPYPCSLSSHLVPRTSPFPPFLLAFVKETAHLLRKTRELLGKTPQLLAKSSLVFRNSRAHLHLIQAKSLACPPFSHRWPCILAAILPLPHNIYPSIPTCLPSSATPSSHTRSSSPHSRLLSRCLLIVLAFYETQTALVNFHSQKSPHTSSAES